MPPPLGPRAPAPTPLPAPQNDIFPSAPAPVPSAPQLNWVLPALVKAQINVLSLPYFPDFLSVSRCSGGHGGALQVLRRAWGPSRKAPGGFAVAAWLQLRSAARPGGAGRPRPHPLRPWQGCPQRLAQSERALQRCSQPRAARFAPGCAGTSSFPRLPSRLPAERRRGSDWLMLRTGRG